MALKRRDSANTLLTLALFLMFAVCAFFVLALSVRAYKASYEESAANDRARTGLAYVVSKVRHADELSSVAVGKFDGLNALFLYETHEDERYATVLYAENNSLCELFAKDVSQFTRDSGVCVVSGVSVRFSLDAQSLLIEFETGDGETQALTLSLRSGGGAA